MAYLSTTEASSVANAPRQLVSRFAGSGANSTQLSTAIPASGGASPYRVQGGGLWLYQSSHGTTEIQDSNFFADGYFMGMRPGDLLFNVQWTTAGSTPVISMHVIESASTAGVATHSAAFISSTYS